MISDREALYKHATGDTRRARELLPRGPSGRCHQEQDLEPVQRRVVWRFGWRELRDALFMFMWIAARLNPCGSRPASFTRVQREVQQQRSTKTIRPKAHARRTAALGLRRAVTSGEEDSSRIRQVNNSQTHPHPQPRE